VPLDLPRPQPRNRSFTGSIMTRTGRANVPHRSATVRERPDGGSYRYRISGLPRVLRRSERPTGDPNTRPSASTSPSPPPPPRPPPLPPPPPPPPPPSTPPATPPPPPPPPPPLSSSPPPPPAPRPSSPPPPTPPPPPPPPSPRHFCAAWAKSTTACSSESG